VAAADAIVMPQPQLNRMQPLWIGKSRWKQSRRRYTQLMNRKMDWEGGLYTERLAADMTKENSKLAEAQQHLTWNRVWVKHTIHRASRSLR
jgi:hypothetical protein